MSTVYVLVRFDGTKLDEILGVFDSYEEADAYRKERGLDDTVNYGDTEIWTSTYLGNRGEEN